MTKLDEKMKAMLAVQLPVQATTGEDGLPDIGPKRSLRVYNDTALIYNENTGGWTLKNIRAGSKMAVRWLTGKAGTDIASSVRR